MEFLPYLIMVLMLVGFPVVGYLVMESDFLRITKGEKRVLPRRAEKKQLESQAQTLERAQQLHRELVTTFASYSMDSRLVNRYPDFQDSSIPEVSDMVGALSELDKAKALVAVDNASKLPSGDVKNYANAVERFKEKLKTAEERVRDPEKYARKVEIFREAEEKALRAAAEKKAELVVRKGMGQVERHVDGHIVSDQTQISAANGFPWASITINAAPGANVHVEMTVNSKDSPG